MFIDLLSGYNPEYGYKSVDYIPNYGIDYLLDLNTYDIDGIPEGSVNKIRCRNGLHHIPNLDKLIKKCLTITSECVIIDIIEPSKECYKSNLFLDNLYYRWINQREDIWFSDRYRNYIQMFENSGFILTQYKQIDEKEYCTFKRRKYA